MKRGLALAAILCPAAWCAQTQPSDYLPQLLQRGSLGWTALLVGLAIAFGLGAVHALSPGHGKTIVAAYLVGSRSTARHAVLLGLIVTFTHTVSVFFLGFVTLFLSRYLLPEKIYPLLGTVSGLGIVWVGATLFHHRLRAARRRAVGKPHSHAPEGDASMASLMALGASGGMMPCPSALVLLLSSVALGRIATGLSLLVAFSAGLAVVLTAIGVVAVYAKRFVPELGGNAAFRWVPVFSAGLIACVGLLMTAAALGVVRVTV